MYLNPFAALILIPLTSQIAGGFKDECNGSKQCCKARAEKSPGILRCSF